MKRVTKVRHMERKIVELLREGESIKGICRMLRVGRARVRAVREKARAYGYLMCETPLPPYPEALFADKADRRAERMSDHWKELLPHLAWIQERLVAGWHAVTVFEELPVVVPRSSFYRFLVHKGLHRLHQRQPHVVPEIVHAPGEALLIDWGHLWTVTTEGKKRQKIWAFIGILGYSRYMVVQVMTRCDLEQTLCALSSLYDALGGVTRRTTSDNPKVFSLLANKYEPVLNPLYERFCGHYGTVAECLPPYEPKKKGKVERPVPYVRRLLEAYAGDKGDLGAIQEYLDKKVALANERRHGTTRERPITRFLTEEKGALKPLPLTPYEREEYLEGTVRLDGHVRFQGKYYSVDERYIRHAVTVIASRHLVSIYSGGTLIEVHERVTDRARSKSTKPHHLRPWQRECENPNGFRELARRVGPAVEEVVSMILERGDGFIDLRKIWGILSLSKKYSAEEVNAGCVRALDEGMPSYHAIIRFIDEARLDAAAQHSSAQSSDTRLPHGKFQHDITHYTQILLALQPKGGTYEQ